MQHCLPLRRQCPLSAAVEKASFASTGGVLIAVRCFGARISQHGIRLHLAGHGRISGQSGVRWVAILNMGHGALALTALSQSTASILRFGQREGGSSLMHSPTFMSSKAL